MFTFVDDLKLEMEDNILNQISQLLKQNPQNFSIVEEQIDIEIQIAYFKMSKSVKESKSNEPFDVLRTKLQDETIDNEDKKKILTILASDENVESYREIERFYNETEGEMHLWASLALRESKMMLETYLLEEKQVLISTGLGGKGTKLRYFIVLISKTNSPFNETQKKVIKNEFEDVLGDVGGVIESIDYDSVYAKILALIDIEVSLKEVLKRAVGECNVFGDFIIPDFVITNVKIFSTEEIDKFLQDAEYEEDDVEELPL